MGESAGQGVGRPGLDPGTYGLKGRIIERADGRRATSEQPATCLRGLDYQSLPVWRDGRVRIIYGSGRAHQTLDQVAPLCVVPDPITDPGRVTALDIHRRDRLCGVWTSKHMLLDLHGWNFRQAQGWKRRHPRVQHSCAPPLPPESHPDPAPGQGPRPGPGHQDRRVVRHASLS